MKNKPAKDPRGQDFHYDSILGDISNLIDAARSSAARSVNSIMTAAYWLVGRRIVESEQKGEKRAGYGEALIEKLAADLTVRYGKGFSVRNVWQMKAFYLSWPILQTLSAEFDDSTIRQTLSAESTLVKIARSFPLPWSAYVRLLSVKKEIARKFYITETLRGGWSVRQLDRQINSQFYERVALSRNKAAMLTKGQKALPEDRVHPEEEIKDPYLNYAREHWVKEGENPPVGLILCAQKDEAVARYALEGLPNKVMASEYRMALPDEKELAAEIERTRAFLEDRKRRAHSTKDRL